MSAKQVTHLRVETLGVPVLLDVHGVDLADAVAAAWVDVLLEADGSDSPSTATTTPISAAVGSFGRADVTGVDIAEVLHCLTAAVVLQATEQRAGELVILHAAALADPETGAAVALVGSAGTGLTTAALTLGDGLAYLSDEVVGIAEDGVVVPLLKPLSVAGPGYVNDQVPATRLGLLTADQPCHLGAIIVLRRDPEHLGDPMVEPLDTVDALAALAAETLMLGHLALPLQRLAALVHLVGGVQRVTYAEAATLDPVIRHLLAKAHP